MNNYVVPINQIKCERERERGREKRRREIVKKNEEKEGVEKINNENKERK